MRKKVLFIERKPSASVSIERVFRQIAAELPRSEFEVEFQSVPYGNGIKAILGNLVFFRPRAADIYHVTGDVHYITLRLPRARTVLTVHDLIFLHRRTGFRRAILKKLFLDIPLTRSAVVTAVSDSTKREILEQTGSTVPIVVIDDPMIGGFSNQPEKPFSSDRPRVLHVGTAPNKNLERLFEAAAGLDLELVIVGHMSGADTAAARKLGISVINKPQLNEHQIVEEYRSCDIVSYCTTYEGFGLPILEAQAMSKPVITSDREPMNWVAGDGALLVDPESAADIRAGLERLIADAELRHTLVSRGRENIKRFRPSRIAAEYARVYNDLMANAEISGK